MFHVRYSTPLVSSPLNCYSPAPMSVLKKLKPANLIINNDLLHKAEPGHYAVNEIFYSLQGEGFLAGTAMVFLRFAECNLRCTVKNAGFDCDTEFVSSRELNISEIIRQVSLYKAQSEWVLLTGGEPALQVTGELISALKKEGFKLAIETNGTIALPDGLDWITVSPKSAEHTIRQRAANEVRYVRGHGTALPESIVRAEHYFISPVFQPDGSLLREDFDWCVDLIKSSRGRWRLSMQSHKLLGIR